MALLSEGDLKNKDKQEVTGSQPILSLTAETTNAGSTSVETVSVGDTTMEDTGDVKDRYINLTIKRDDTGCEWAYDNEVSVYNAINRYDTILNNGFDVIINQEYLKNPQAKDAKKLIERRIRDLRLRDVTSNEIKNRLTYGFSVTKIIPLGNGGDIDTLVVLDSKECRPVRNLMTGKLGGVRINDFNPAYNTIDPNNPIGGINKPAQEFGMNIPPEDVAMIQIGNSAIYTALGTVSYVLRYYYFKNEEIIAINDNDRGKFKGTSRVMRILRFVEIKKNLENIIDLIARRFGPQVWVTVGNETYNLNKSDLPASYLRDSSGNPVDPATARKNFKTQKMTDINTAIKKWIDGDALVNLAEFGIDAKTFNPSSSLLDYAKYIELFADYIKIGILGMDIPGRIDVTSSIMQDKLTRDVRDNVIRDRMTLEDYWMERIIEPVLRANGYPDNMVSLKFKSLDKMEQERDAKIMRDISDTIYNFSKAGWIDIPDFIKEQLKISDKEVKEKLDPMAFQAPAAIDRDGKPIESNIIKRNIDISKDMSKDRRKSAEIEVILDIFDFIDKFQKETPQKIFFVEDSNKIELYYVERGITFNSMITKEQLFDSMREKYKAPNMEEAIKMFKDNYLKDYIIPLSVNKTDLKPENTMMM